MAYDPATGKWKDENASVASHVTGLMAQNSPMIKQAKTAGMQQANRRGLLNSSMAVGAAQGAAYTAAVPVASQEAGQAHQRNLQAAQTGSQEKIVQMNIAAHDRQHSATVMAEVQKKYGALFDAIQKNNELSAGARNKYYEHAAALRDQDLNLLEQLYGIELEWDTITATHG